LPQPLEQLGRHPSRLRRMVTSLGWNTALFLSITQTGTGGCCECYSLLSGTRLNLSHPSDDGHAAARLGNANPGCKAAEVASSWAAISSTEAEIPAVILGKRKKEK
jgi:hypothetical protein